MKTARCIVLFWFALLTLSMPALAAGQTGGPIEGTYEFRFDYFGTMTASLRLTPAGKGDFAVQGSVYVAGKKTEQTTWPVSGTLRRDGQLRAVAKRPGGKGESKINGEWNKAKATLFITEIDGRPVNDPEGGKRLAEASGPRLGIYQGRSLRFKIEKTPNADQARIVGYYTIPMPVALEVRGTYYFKRNDFVAFGEIRNAEEAFSAKLDGKYEDGIFKIHVVVENLKAKKVTIDEWVDCEYDNSMKPLQEDKEKEKEKDKDKPAPQPSRGSIGGSVQMDRASARIGETLKLNLSYNLKGRDEDTVMESVALYGPGEVLATRSDKERTLVNGTPRKTSFDIKCDKPGVYRVRVLIKGELSDEWKDSASFTIEKPKAAEAAAVSGSYGLVKKLVPKSPAPETNPQGYTMSATVGEGSLQITMTPNAGTFSGFNLNMSWSAPPPILRPGQIVELTCSASGTRSERDTPGVTASAWFGFKGVQVLEQQHAWAGFPRNEVLSDSGTGKYKFKVPENASGGEIVIEQGYTGSSYGSGFHRPCTYTYQWNAKPMDDDKGTDKPAPQGTSMVSTTPDDLPRQIRARIEPSSVTLRAGETSTIVNITISGFRTNTSDRVEVLFPQATDGWAPLPGQIVVGGGAGSYDPANMGRPEHADGYFFSARSTAPDSEQTIDVVVRQKGAGEARLKLQVKVVGRNPTVADPPANIGQWTGTWAGGLTTPWLPLVLNKNGNTLSGTFCKGQAKIRGTVSGDKFTFTFENYLGSDGTGELVMKPDGSLHGFFQEKGDPTKWMLTFSRE